MSITQMRLSNQAKEQLVRFKTRTGVPHWNVLCPWAFCLSLKETSQPAPLGMAVLSVVLALPGCEVVLDDLIILT